MMGRAGQDSHWSRSDNIQKYCTHCTSIVLILVSCAATVVKYCRYLRRFCPPWNVCHVPNSSPFLPPPQPKKKKEVKNDYRSLQVFIILRHEDVIIYVAVFLFSWYDQISIFFKILKKIYKAIIYKLFWQ